MKTTPVYREKNLGIEFTGSHSHLNKEDENTLSDLIYTVYMRLPMKAIAVVAVITPILYFGYRFIEFVTSH